MDLGEFGVGAAGIGKGALGIAISLAERVVELGQTDADPGPHPED